MVRTCLPWSLLPKSNSQLNSFVYPSSGDTSSVQHRHTQKPSRGGLRCYLGWLFPDSCGSSCPPSRSSSSWVIWWSTYLIFVRKKENMHHWGRWVGQHCSQHSSTGTRQRRWTTALEQGMSRHGKDDSALDWHSLWSPLQWNLSLWGLCSDLKLGGTITATGRAANKWYQRSYVV